MASQKRKKVDLKIKRDFQVWLLGRILGVCFLTIGIACVFSYLYAKNLVDAEFLRLQTNTRPIGEVFLPVFLAASLTSIVAGLLLALLLPSRIAGPLHRVEQDLKQIGSGDLTKTINLRSDDILKEHAEAINMAMGEIGKMIQDVKDSGNILEIKIVAGKVDELQIPFNLLKEQLDRIITNKP